MIFEAENLIYFKSLIKWIMSHCEECIFHFGANALQITRYDLSFFIAIEGTCEKKEFALCINCNHLKHIVKHFNYKLSEKTHMIYEDGTLTLKTIQSTGKINDLCIIPVIECTLPLYPPVTTYDANALMDMWYLNRALLNIQKSLLIASHTFDVNIDTILKKNTISVQASAKKGHVTLVTNLSNDTHDVEVRCESKCQSSMKVGAGGWDENITHEIPIGGLYNLKCFQNAGLECLFFLKPDRIMIELYMIGCTFMIDPVKFCQMTGTIKHAKRHKDLFSRIDIKACDKIITDKKFHIFI